MTEFEFRELLNRLAGGWANRDYAVVAEAFSEDVRYSDPLRYAFADRTSPSDPEINSTIFPKPATPTG